jgi:hypothetical protein
MSKGESDKYARFSVQQLEEMIMRPGLAEQDLKIIHEELTKRYTRELLQATKRGASVSEPRPQEPRPLAAQQSSSAPPGSMPLREPAPISSQQTPGNMGRGCGCLVLAIIGIVFLLALVASNATKMSNPGFGPADRSVTTQSYGYDCVTEFGSCRLPQPLPVGSPCTCTDGVNVYQGVVR